MKFGTQSTKFDGSIPVNDASLSDKHRRICELFRDIVLQAAPNNAPGWHLCSISFHANELGVIDRIGELKIYSTGEDRLFASAKEIEAPE